MAAKPPSHESRCVPTQALRDPRQPAQKTCSSHKASAKLDIIPTQYTIELLLRNVAWLHGFNIPRTTQQLFCLLLMAPQTLFCPPAGLFCIWYKCSLHDPRPQNLSQPKNSLQQKPRGPQVPCKLFKEPLCDSVAHSDSAHQVRSPDQCLTTQASPPSSYCDPGPLKTVCQLPPFHIRSRRNLTQFKSVCSSVRLHVQIATNSPFGGARALA